MFIGGVLFDKSRKMLVCYPAGKSGAYTIPSSVTAIGDGAFYSCGSLTSVTLSRRTIVGKDAFDDGVLIQYRD